MVMAATGSNHKERRLAQPPRGFQGARRRRGLHFPIWVAAVLLVAALSLLIFPLARGEAATAPTGVTPTGVTPGGVTATGVTPAGATPLVAAGAESVIVPILFPLEERVYWTDTFGAARSGGRTHAGNDLMAPKMTPILAVVDGKVDWLNLSGQPSSYNSLPYYNILLRGDDGNDYFYIHLNNDTPGTDDGQGGVEYAYAPGLTNGTHVEAGDVIGYVGDSGNAEDCDSHLHFEIHLGGYVGAGTGQTRSPSAIDPYASLKAAPTLDEWDAAGRPPLATWGASSGPASTAPTSTTTTVKPTNTLVEVTTTTTTAKVTTTTTAPSPTPSTPAVTPGNGGTKVPGYSDVLTTDWFYEDFAQARTAGVVTASDDGRFRPYSKVSRALFAVYLVRTMAPEELQREPVVAGAEPTFADVETDHWAYNEIETAARLGLVHGTGDGTAFSPDELVSRAQMATMICRALDLDINDDWAGRAAAAYQLYEDVPEGYWAQGAIAMVDYLGLMCGDADGCFRPQESTTRAQAISVMARLLRMLEGGSES